MGLVKDLFRTAKLDFLIENGEKKNQKEENPPDFQTPFINQVFTQG